MTNKSVRVIKGPARGEIPNERADELAVQLFGEIRGLNNWDRRRVLQRMERLHNKERRAA